MRATTSLIARVVLHGAGAQRIHAVIDGVVPGGEAREVADGFHLADFGKAVDSGAHVLRAERFGGDHRRGRRVPGAGTPACRASCARTAALRSARDGCGLWLDLSQSASAGSDLRQPRPYRARFDISVAHSSMESRQLGIEAAQRQPADDFLLQQGRVTDPRAIGLPPAPRIR